VDVREVGLAGVDGPLVLRFRARGVGSSTTTKPTLERAAPGALRAGHPLHDDRRAGQGDGPCAPLSGLPAVLLIDKTGVGAAVLDAFEHSGIRPTAITIHGGSAVTYDPQRRGYRVPKRDLVSAVQVLLQNGRLKIASSLPEAATLKNKLFNFRVKVDPATAHDSYEHWREGDHDDLVLAVAMACWFRGARTAGREKRLARRDHGNVARKW